MAQDGNYIFTLDPGVERLAQDAQMAGQRRARHSDGLGYVAHLHVVAIPQVGEHGPPGGVAERGEHA